MTIALLRNPIQNYDWGSHTDIATLQGRDRSGSPEAELWMGAYPEAPSEVLIDGQWHRLDAVLDRFVDGQTQNQFGRRLPFLMKYLAIARPLSIQVHPDDKAAAKGFDEGVFKDAYGKPELIYALTPVEMLVGIRPAQEVAGFLSHIGREDWVEELAELSPGEIFVASLATTELLDNVKNAPHLARELTWLPELLLAHPHDPAATAPLFMNSVHLKPGEALYVPAGTVHCYLSGFAVEVMASSDNVIRAGMTSKPVDLQLFTRHANLTSGPAHYIAPTVVDSWEHFRTGTAEFELSRTVLNGQIECAGLAILACKEGSLVISDGAVSINLSQGDSAIVSSNASVTLRGEAVVYRCALPTA